MNKERKQYIIEIRPHIYKADGMWVWVLRCYFDDSHIMQATRWQGSASTPAELAPYMRNRLHHMRRTIQQYNAWARKHNGE